MEQLTYVLGGIIYFALSIHFIPEKLGTKREIGYYKSTAACFFLSPIVGLLIPLSSPKLEKHNKANVKQRKKENTLRQDILDKKIKLNELKRSGLLTDEEFFEKYDKVIDDSFIHHVKQSNLHYS
jgi:hypothetical protein